MKMAGCEIDGVSPVPGHARLRIVPGYEFELSGLSGATVVA